MAIFKKIKPADRQLSEHIFHKKQNFTCSDAGIHAQTYVSGANGTTGSYWESLRVNFYLSGSNLNGNSTGSDESHYINSPNYSLADYFPKMQTHMNKFHSQKSGSVISIGQKHFGESIKRKTFELTDKSTVKTIIIRDDGFGNLYAVGNTISQSTNHASSSDNYIGNIFYDVGIATITSTGSYSQSVSYSDVTKKNYSIKFDSTQTIYTQEYEIEISATEYNASMNRTLRGIRSGSNLWQTHNESPYIQNQFTSSDWKPYVTQIHLYNDNGVTGNINKEPLIIGTLPRPIQIRDDMTIKIRLKLDM